MALILPLAVAGTEFQLELAKLELEQAVLAQPGEIS
eukprot:CAMPEP_0196742404 /NCGR_PEP_ID=MMETSP1091-20130531/46585_1 /TAXON_ID=302021 /ORGANISM="Rhodomonas sp., Strain CCMP768" /LENGTH=35 /DNA_ID= /DNA_START= /DNA_END= /DNA_ORIENTATION=